MTREEFQGLVKREPFVPFRLFTTAGDWYDVLSPRLVLVKPTCASIGILPFGAQRPIAVDLDFVQYEDMSRVEDLPTSMAIPLQPKRGR